MAALGTQDRLDAAGVYMASENGIGTFSGVTKTDIRAAFNALDDFLVTNAASVNNALPAAAKANLTTSQKARLLVAVITKRYITGA